MSPKVWQVACTVQLRIAPMMLAVVPMLAAGCDEGATTPQPTESASAVRQEWVTPEVAQSALDGSGRFRIPGPSLSGDEITGSEAEVLASNWLRNLAPFHVGGLADHRGAPVVLTEIRRCEEPVRYAPSSYENVRDLPIEQRRVYGAHWLIKFCDQRGPAIVLAVSAHSREFLEGVRADPLGRVPGSANVYFSLGIPSRAGDIPVSPERAVELVVMRTGARVASVPQLVQSERPKPPQFSWWRIQTDRNVNVRGLDDNSVRSTTTLFVGISHLRDSTAFAIADPQQPATFPTVVSAPGRELATGSDTRIKGPELIRVADRPVRFILVTPTR